jgi:ribosomal protein S8
MLNTLWDHRLIAGYRVINKNYIKIYLKFDSSGNSLIKNLYLMSKPGKKRYVKVFNIKNNIKKNNVLLFINTSKGILTYNEALKFNLGGELLLKICI